MNIYKCLFIILSCYSVSGLIDKNTLISKKISTKLNSKIDINDINTINKFKFYFDTTDYNNVINDLDHNKLSKIYVDNNFRQIVTIDNLPDNDYLYSHYHIGDINPIVLPNLLEKSSQLHIPVYFTNFVSSNMLDFSSLFKELANLSYYVFPVLFLLSLISSFRNINSLPTQRGNFNNNLNMDRNGNNNPFRNMFQKKEPETVNVNVTLDNWAGSPEVLDECKEVISYIENKEKYNKIGAEMPKGILLEGPPGTGKTLLAKAIASETNSTFFSISGSEFVEIFVGMGASKVRDLFNNARINKPCIIFIDEIDAVGRQRGTGINMGNDEREQTLNQLLYEMDGFNNNDDIVVIAATNRRDVLDQALLRPGRFDRIIRVPVPDKESRMKILEFYLQNKYVQEGIDISAVAELTDGFSGAQLKNLINEAAILSVKNNFDSIQENFIFDAFEKLLVGLIKNSSSVAESTRLRVAIHESGHSILTLLFDDYFDFKKASIQPTYNGAGGYTIFSEKPEIKEGGLYTKDILKKRLIIAMGGKAAEEIYYGNEFISLGAVQDLKQANSLAQRMIGNFGMGNELEVFYNEDVGDDSNPFLGRSLALGDKYSEHTRFIMDKESLNLVKEAYSAAKLILHANRDKLIEFSNSLLNNTIVYKKDLQNDFTDNIKDKF